MILNAKEAIIAWVSLFTTGKVDAEGKQDGRLFPLSELKTVQSLKALITEKLIKEDKFEEGEIEFTADQKKLILRCLDREWTTIDAEHVLSLQEKLA